MKQFLTDFTLLLIIVLIVNSCGGSSEVYKENKTSDNNNGFRMGSIVSEMLEQARQNYISALAKKEEGDINSTVEYFESALRNINNLSYYPSIEQNDAYLELAKSITEDYKSFIDRLGELPEGVSFAILLMNAVTPLINRGFKPQRFGVK